MLPIPYGRAVARIEQHLRDGDGFFIVCVGDADAIAPTVVDALQDYRVAAIWFGEDSLPWDEILATNAAVVSCSFVSKCLIPSVVSRLNVGREHLNSTQPKVLLWVGMTDVENFARSAPDLWSYRTEVLQFLSEHDFDSQISSRPNEVSFGTIGEFFAAAEQTLEWTSGTNRPTALLELANHAVMLGDSPLAVELLEEAHSLSPHGQPTTARYFLLRCAVLRSLNQWSQLSVELATVAKYHSGPLVDWVISQEQLQLVIHAGRIREALVMLEQAQEHSGLAKRFVANIASSLIAIANQMVIVGYVSEALGLLERAERSIDEAPHIEIHFSNEVALDPDVFLLRAAIATVRAQIAVNRAEPVEALVFLHEAARIRATAGAFALFAQTCDIIAAIFDSLGLTDAAAGARRRISKARDELRVAIPRAVAAQPAERFGSHVETEPTSNLDAAIDSFIAIPNAALGQEDLARARELLDDAERLWRETDPAYRSIFRGAKIAQLRSTICVRVGEYQAAVDELVSCNQTLAAATLHFARVDVLLQLANIAQLPQEWDLMRENAADEALLIVSTAGLIRAEQLAREAVANLARKRTTLAQKPVQ